MDVEKLIEGVKKRPILYESTKKAYKDAARRDDLIVVLGRGDDIHPKPK